MLFFILSYQVCFQKFKSRDCHAVLITHNNKQKRKINTFFKQKLKNSLLKKIYFLSKIHFFKKTKFIKKHYFPKKPTFKFQAQTRSKSPAVIDKQNLSVDICAQIAQQKANRPANVLAF